MLEDEWLRYILYCFGILSVSTLYCVMWPWCGDAAQARPITSLYCRDQMWAPSILYIAAQTKCPPTILAASLPAYIPFHFPSFMFSFLIWSLTSGPKKDKKTKRQKDKRTKGQKDERTKTQKDKKGGLGKRQSKVFLSFYFFLVSRFTTQRSSCNIRTCVSNHLGQILFNLSFDWTLGRFSSF